MKTNLEIRVKARIVESTILPGYLSIRSMDGSEKGLKRLLAETFKAGDEVEIRKEENFAHRVERIAKSLHGQLPIPVVFNPEAAEREIVRVVLDFDMADKEEA